MTKKTLDKIVWWIPIRKYRDAIRKHVINKYNITTPHVNRDDPWFNECLNKFINLDKNKRFEINENNFYIILNDNTATTNAGGHYAYHPPWAFRLLVSKIKPKKHIDISSITHFATMVSAVIPVEFYDIRPANLILDNLKCKKADLMDLPFEDNSIESISCMHTIEHVGLGRYGDDIDPDGDIKAINELKRVCKKGGSILFVVPMGKARLQYNAHRIYSYDMIMEYFNDVTLKEFVFLPDNGGDVGMIINADRDYIQKQNYGCGCFWFQK